MYAMEEDERFAQKLLLRRKVEVFSFFPTWALGIVFSL